jgi:hypothetical protein
MLDTDSASQMVYRCMETTATKQIPNYHYSNYDERMDVQL